MDAVEAWRGCAVLALPLRHAQHQALLGALPVPVLVSLTPINSSLGST